MMRMRSDFLALPRLALSRIVIFLVIFMVGGCGNFRQLPWPASISGFSNFSDDQKQAVLASIDNLNQNEATVLVDPQGGNNQYPISFTLVDPTQSTEDQAGLADVGSDHCAISLSTELFTDQRKSFLEPVVWHELGHCAGLLHVPDSGAVMYYMTQPMADYAQDELGQFFSTIRSSAGM